ncbi:hypothetical protein GSI_15590 [Ganoderma sinense ZZ0214-1]|uniref:Transporter n=1 Tax=Ganoderma sinense ZZ0214-1 TaxID=1077348 RepID=A0A2G8RN07_9APHY|nr:hypothetical protein GSI_15590 [Ganoderma sinense ZZ0214-1]
MPHLQSSSHAHLTACCTVLLRRLNAAFACPHTQKKRMRNPCNAAHWVPLAFASSPACLPFSGGPDATSTSSTVLYNHQDRLQVLPPYRSPTYLPCHRIYDIPLPVNMHGPPRGGGRAGEHIDIPAFGRGDDDDDDDDDDDGGGGREGNRTGGVAAHQLQLPPLPANATPEQVMQAYRDAQLAIRAYAEELKESRAAQAQSSSTAGRAANKQSSGQNSRDPPPPPELASLAKQIAKRGREYCVLINLWPPVAYWSAVTLQRPNVDPYDPADRYPGSGAGIGRARGTRGQDVAAQALQDAIIAELHDFMGELSVHLTNEWVQKKFARSVNTRKGHMLDTLRGKRVEVFSGLPGVDMAILNSNDLTRIRTDPVIQRWISTSSSGSSKKWPDLFYRSDKIGNIKYLFRVPWLPRAMKLMTQGRQSLTEGHHPRSNVSAAQWGLTDASFGFIASGAVAILHLLSGDPSFEPKPGPSGLNYPQIHAQIVKHLIKAQDTRQVIFLFEWLRKTVFGSLNPDTTEMPASQDGEQDSDSDEDYAKLDEPDSDEGGDEDSDAETSGTRLTASTPFVESASSGASFPNQPRVPHSNLPRAPPAADALTSSSSALSYASVPAVQHFAPPPQGARPYVQQVQPAGQQSMLPVVALPGALSNPFDPTDNAYVVVPPGPISSYSHGITHTAGRTVPHPGVPVSTHVVGTSPAPAPMVGVPMAHRSAVHDVPPLSTPVAPTVAPVVNNVAINLPPPPSDPGARPSASSHFPPPHAVVLAPTVVHAPGEEQIHELSEAASHLNVGTTKRRGGRTKQAVKPPAPANRYPTRARGGQS